MRRQLAAPLLALVISGCGTYIPEIKEPWDNKGNSVVSSNGVLESDIKEKIYCAIYDAVKAQRNLPSSWAVQSTLDLQVDQNGVLSPGASFIKPLAGTDTFTLGVGAILSSQSTREDKFGSYWDLDRLKAQFTRECDDASTIDGSSPLITNDLGLTQWLTDAIEADRAIPSSPQAKNNTFNQDAFTYHVKFIVITTGTLSPAWKLVKFATTNSAPLASISRTRTHDILLTFGPKFKPNSPNIALTQHSAGEYSTGIGNALHSTVP